MKADLILAGGRIRTLGRSGLEARSHLAIGGGLVLACGGSEVMGLRGPRTRVVDLRRGAVLPGFNDAHAHVVYYGLTRFAADLLGARGIDEILERLAAHAAGLQPGEWQQGIGYRSNELVERRQPHRRELDRVTGNRPCFIDERGGHSRVANSAALAAAGISSTSANPPGGRIGRDLDGSPNGLLLETAMRLVADVQPAPSLDRRMEGIRRAQQLLVSRGVTSVGAAVNRGFADDLVAFQRLDESGELHMRVEEFLSWELLDAAVQMGLRARFGGRRLKAGPIKVFIDGGADRVAIRGGGGMWRIPPSELNQLVAKATQAGLQVAAHAIGDGAIEAMCDAVEAVGDSRLRHRIEHCTICPADLRRRIARLGVVAVMQPLAARFARGEGAHLFAAPNPADLAPHGPLLKAGVHLAFSSDLPVVPDPNPWPGIWAAVEDPVHGINLLDALLAYTKGGAYASGEEGVKGTLDEGMVADLQVYAADPLAASEREKEVRPQAVLVGGATVFGRLR